MMDHDLLIRIDENVKSIKDRLAICGGVQHEHEERISLVEGEMKAVQVRQGVWSAIAVGVSGAVSAVLKLMK